jgi:transcriptional regulator with XRE-family HTH domain
MINAEKSSYRFSFVLGVLSMKNNLRYWRIKKGYSQRALGEAVGVLDQSIANYEKSKNRPRLDTQRRLSEVLGVPIDELFTDSEEIAHFATAS